ncbi:MAG: MFS transporter, partial [Angelakisella sp.]
MKPKQRLIIFIYHFGSGIMQPVMALMLIAHGCTLQTLPLALAAYGIVALCLELPSGVYADRNGRKRT